MRKISCTIKFIFILFIIFTAISTAIVFKGFHITKDSYSEDKLTEDEILQYNYLKASLPLIADKKVTISSDYSNLCGYSLEWESVFFTFYSMTLDEMAQIVPEKKDEIKEQMDICAKGVLDISTGTPLEEVFLCFKDNRYGHNPIYDGYFGIVLSLRKLRTGDNYFDGALHQVAKGLKKYLERCLGDKKETFFTSDHAAELYALYLFDKATGSDHSDLFIRWEEQMKKRFLEKDTGLLYTRVSTNPDEVVYEPRGSSLAWTVICLSQVMPEFAAQQYESMVKYRNQQIFNYEVTSEYFHYPMFSFGDIDSGPLIMGYSPSATGFALACHKIYGQKRRFIRTLRVFEMFGKPLVDEQGKRYYLGNAMGDAILLYGKLVRPR